MFGDKNKIVKHAIKKPEGDWNPFESGATDSFKFDEVDVGKVRLSMLLEIRLLTRMLLAQDDHDRARRNQLRCRMVLGVRRGQSERCHLHVMISAHFYPSLSDGLTLFRFPVERWLDKKEDDGRISLELEPNKKPSSKKTAGESRK